MKIPRIVNAMSNIDDELILRTTKRSASRRVLRWSTVAACFVIMLTALFTVPAFFKDIDPLPPTGTEYLFEKSYFYSVENGEFSTYIAGKVIAEEKIGNKIADVSVAGGWKNSKDEWSSKETLRAEIYEIDGIEKDVAVALKFIDKGEAVTTTHYYVIMNSEADLSTLEEYAIAPRENNDEALE